MNRRNFLSYVSLGALWTAFLSACGGGGSAATDTGAPTPPANADCEANGTNVTVGVTNAHTHVCTIPAADVTAGAQNVYTLQAGSTGHTHTVTITAADFTSLKNTPTQTIMETSTVNGHSHSVTVGCV